MQAYIDIVGRCNLKCPSCPMGNSFDKGSVGGSMSPDLLAKILTKLVKEKSVDYVGLYNWTEPLLHPRIGEMIRVVKSFGLPCYISTNLNVVKHLEEVVLAAPEFLRISVSGFSNHVYQKQHSGGDIEVVKENMRILASLIEKHKPNIHVQVYYLRWLGNMDDEFLMQHYAESLGFSFKPDWTWLSPIEKVVTIFTGGEGVSEDDLNTAANLSRPFVKTILAARKIKNIDACSFLSEYIVLDCTGGVSLCCGVYDQNRFTVGNYLEHSWDDFIKLKMQNANCMSMCKQCMDLGLPELGQSNQEFNALAAINMLERYSKRLGVTLS